MANLTDFAENKLIDFLLRNQALGIAGSVNTAGITSLHVGLLTVAPTDSTAGTEVSGGAYARVSVTNALANWAGTQGAGTTVASSGTGGQTSNNAAITFPTPTANWGTVVAFGIYDAATAGNLIIFGTISPNKTVNNGDPAPSFAAAALGLTFA